MEPTENRPAPRRLTEDELVAALRHDGLGPEAVTEVTGHRALDLLLAYRREVSGAKPNAARKLLEGGPRGRQTPPRADEATGHRNDTAQRYLEMRDAFPLTEPVIDEE